MKKVKIVIDTNLWISFIIKAKQAELIAFLLDNNLTVYTSEELVRELKDVLQRSKIKKYLSRPVSEYIDFHQQIAVKAKIKTSTMQSADPKDNYLIDLMLTTRATYLVTGDKQLLATSHTNAFEIITFSKLKTIISSL